MITFDKLKIITSMEYVDCINSHCFVQIKKSDEVLYYKYQQKTPYSLLLMVDYTHSELILEFTSKILMDDYPKLINSATITQCLQNINQLGICKLDIEAILQDSEVVKCDITKDIDYDLQNIISTVGQNIVNYGKWSCKVHRNGCVVENIVSTPKYKKRLTIYNKSDELEKATNKLFIDMLENRQSVLNYFQGKTRFELNINTKHQIRQLLNIPNNNLDNVLSSTANPILTVIDESIKYEPRHYYKTQTLRDYERELLLKDSDFDLAKVEAKIRALSSKNTSVKRLMQPYRELYARVKSRSTPFVDIRELVA